LGRRVSELEPISQPRSFALDETSNLFPLSERPRARGWRVDWLTLGPCPELNVPAIDVIDVPQLAPAHAHGALGFDGCAQGFDSDCSCWLQLRFVECEQPLVQPILGFMAQAERRGRVVRKHSGLGVAARAQGGSNFPNRMLHIRVAARRL
jgi:hypothetical protein